MAVTVAIVRHGLLDIRLVVSRALAWLLLSLAVVVGVRACWSRCWTGSSPRYLSRSALATVVLVLVAAPLLPRLQRLVDRAMYGDRADPTRVVSELGRAPGHAGAGLAGVAVSIRDSLRLPYVALERDDAVLASRRRAARAGGRDGR